MPPVEGGTDEVSRPEAWILSPEAECVEVRILSGGKRERVAVQVDGLLLPTRFPGVSIEVKSNWPAAI
jgi:hypothetical protein